MDKSANNINLPIRRMTSNNNETLMQYNFLGLYAITEATTIESLAKIPNGKDIDIISKNLYTVAQKLNNFLPLFRSIYSLEFQSVKQKATILRGNTLSSKITDFLVKEITDKYMANLLKSLLPKLMDPSVDLEIDPT